MKKVGRAGDPNRWEKDKVPVKITLYPEFDTDARLINILSRIPRSTVTNYVKSLLLLGFQQNVLKHIRKGGKIPSVAVLELAKETFEELEKTVAESEQENSTVQEEQSVQQSAQNIDTVPNVEPAQTQNIGPNIGPTNTGLGPTNQNNQQSSTGFGFLDQGGNNSGFSPQTPKKLNF